MIYFSVDVPFFSTSLEKYTTERTLVEKVPDKKPIGMLYLDCIKLKQVLMPSPLKCLDVSYSNVFATCISFMSCNFSIL